MESGLAEVVEEWESLEKDCEQLETQHKDYLSKLAEIQSHQKESSKRLGAFQKKCSNLKEQLKRLDVEKLSETDAARARDLLAEVGERKSRAINMQEELPREDNGLYLGIILGSLNVSLMNKTEKFRYKDEYEKFKLTIQIIAFVFASIAYMAQTRVIDACFHFLLVWYYCTLTIRESILRVNGSRIKGWWVFHHYVSTVLCGISLTWPDGECYQAFRRQFLLFSLFLSLVQLLQSQYQRGCLYRLRSLGQRHSMDITVDGFHSWMFKGLTFLLPFLFVAYLFQLYNSVRLLQIYWNYSCSEWQVLALALLFLILSVGNTLTTGKVCWKKIKERQKAAVRRRLVTKYSVSDVAEAEKKQE